MNNGRPLSSYISRETSLRIQPRQWQQQKLKSKQHTSSTSCYTNSNVDLSMCFRGLYVRSIETIAIEQSSSLLSLSNNPILPSVVIDAIDVATNSDSILHKHLGTIKHNSHNSNPSKLDVISDTSIYFDFDVIIDPVVPFIFKLDEDYRSKIEYTLLNFPYWKDMGCTLNRSGNGAFNIHIARQYEAINTSLQTVAKLKHLQLRLTFSQINNNGNNHQRELTSEMLGDIVGYTLKQLFQNCGSNDIH
ncbi:hypothetical protein BDF19DRAFT_125905 [Syncephalis fuscata]|nr:hypothetical protein BDF19DRAFT_125905 [Syncephalis fuscata]